MKVKQIEQMILLFRIGAFLCCSLALLFYFYPLFDYFMTTFDYFNSQRMGDYSVNKPVFPDLPPLIIALPFFFVGVIFFFGAQFLQRLKQRDQNLAKTKLLIWLVFTTPLFSFALFGYLVDHLPMKYKNLLGASSFDEVFTPIEELIIENAEMGIRISKPEGWYAYWMDLNSKRALLIRENKIQKDEAIDSSPYFIIIKYGAASEQPLGQVVAGMQRKFSGEFASYMEHTNRILNISDYPVVKVTSSYDNNGLPYHLEYWVMERNRFTYLIYYANPENQKENISIFEALVKNTTFI